MFSSLDMFKPLSFAMAEKQSLTKILTDMGA